MGNTKGQLIFIVLVYFILYIQEKAADRSARLEESLMAQQYFSDASEAELWMKEKEPIVASNDYGKDEDSAQALLKKHETVMSDVTAFGSTVETLKEQASKCNVCDLYILPFLVISILGKA